MYIFLRPTVRTFLRLFFFVNVSMLVCGPYLQGATKDGIFFNICWLKQLQKNNNNTHEDYT